MATASADSGPTRHGMMILWSLDADHSKYVMATLRSGRFSAPAKIPWKRWPAHSPRAERQVHPCPLNRRHLSRVRRQRTGRRLWRRHMTQSAEPKSPTVEGPSPTAPAARFRNELEDYTSRYVECGLRWTRWRPRARGIAGQPQAWSWGCERSIRAGRAALLRTAKACGSGTRGWCQIGGGFRKPNRGSQNRQFADDGGKRNSSPGRARHKPSNHCAGKAGCSPLDPVCSCAHFFVHIAHETAGAARTRSSLRPLTMERGMKSPTARALRAARSRIHVPCSSKDRDAMPHEKTRPSRPGSFIVEVSGRERISARPG
ncbi:hypothetical protein V1294_005098 [Bradyrhizobium sp. AZCC 1678]